MLLFVSLLPCIGCLHCMWFRLGTSDPDVRCCHMPHPVMDSISCTVGDLRSLLLDGLLR